jgi:hypothetical protein
MKSGERSMEFSRTVKRLRTVYKAFRAERRRRAEPLGVEESGESTSARGTIPVWDNSATALHVL